MNGKIECPICSVPWRPRHQTNKPITERHILPNRIQVTRTSPQADGANAVVLATMTTHSNNNMDPRTLIRHLNRRPPNSSSNSNWRSTRQHRHHQQRGCIPIPIADRTPLPVPFGGVSVLDKAEARKFRGQIGGAQALMTIVSPRIARKRSWVPSVS